MTSLRLALKLSMENITNSSHINHSSSVASISGTDDSSIGSQGKDKRPQNESDREKDKRKRSNSESEAKNPNKKRSTKSECQPENTSSSVGSRTDSANESTSKKRKTATAKESQKDSDMSEDALKQTESAAFSAAPVMTCPLDGDVEVEGNDSDCPDSKTKHEASSSAEDVNDHVVVETFQSENECMADEVKTDLIGERVTQGPSLEAENLQVGLSSVKNEDDEKPVVDDLLARTYSLVHGTENGSVEEEAAMEEPEALKDSAIEEQSLNNGDILNDSISHVECDSSTRLERSLEGGKFKYETTSDSVIGDKTTKKIAPESDSDSAGRESNNSSNILSPEENHFNDTDAFDPLPLTDTKANETEMPCDTNAPISVMTSEIHDDAEAQLSISSSNSLPDPDVPRYRSSRAAAESARSKLSSRAAKKQEAGDDKDSFAREGSSHSTSSSNNGEESIDNPSASPRSKQAKKEQVSKSKDRKSSKFDSVALSMDTESTVPEWVQCDLCSKWRLLPAHIDASTLPEKWFCSMNTWDERKSCEALEEEEILGNEEVEDEGTGKEDEDISTRVDSSAAANAENRELQSLREASRELSTSSHEENADVVLGLDVKSGYVSGSTKSSKSAKKNGKRSSLGNADDSEETVPPPALDQGVEDKTDLRSVSIAVPSSVATTTSSPSPHSSSQSSSASAGSKRKTRVTAGNTDVSSVSGSSNVGVVTSDSNNQATVWNNANNSTVMQRVMWVQCNKCEKWRKVPASVKIDSLPEVWLCTMNTWAPSLAKCTAKEEQEDTAQTEALSGDHEIKSTQIKEAKDVLAINTANNNSTPGPHTSNKKKKKEASLQTSVDPTERCTESSISTAAATPSAKGSRTEQYINNNTNLQNTGSTSVNTNFVSAIMTTPGQKKVTQWVQCERRNCKKWRKVPAHMDMSQFPEKWYCEMNDWDVDRASCDWPEDSDSENEQGNSGDGRSQLIHASAKGPGALSYRRIIFGADGRVRPSYSEKSKNGYGLFSFTEGQQRSHSSNQAENVENSTEGVTDSSERIRRLRYWWSCGYDENGANFVSACRRYTGALGPNKREKEKEKVSLSTENITDSMLAGRSLSVSMDAKSSKYMTSMLSAIRRGSGWTAKAPAVPKRGNNDELLHDLTVFERMGLERKLIRSCLSGSPIGSLTIDNLSKLLAAARFFAPKEEACRAGMSLSTLRIALRRMEEANEIEINLNGKGEAIIQIVNQSDNSILTVSRKSRPERLPPKLQRKVIHGSTSS